MDQQINLELEPGLLDRFETLEDTIIYSVYSGRKMQKSIAYDLDESPSSLTRKVKGDLEFPVSKLSALMECTGDLTPLYWLIEKHLAPKPGDRERALNKASACLEGYPELQQVIDTLIRASGDVVPMKGRKA